MFVAISLIAAAFTTATPAQAQVSPSAQMTATTAAATTGGLTKRQRSTREAHYNMLVRRGIPPTQARAIVTKKYGGDS